MGLLILKQTHRGNTKAETGRLPFARQLLELNGQKVKLESAWFQ